MFKRRLIGCLLNLCGLALVFNAVIFNSIFLAVIGAIAMFEAGVLFEKEFGKYRVTITKKNSDKIAVIETHPDTVNAFSERKKLESDYALLKHQAD